MLFGAIYEHFSFGVYSRSMIYAFIPFLTTTLISAAAVHFGLLLTKDTRTVLTLAAATLTLGMISRGVIEIYGTENRLLAAYSISGAVLTAVSIVLIIRDVLSGRKSMKDIHEEQTASSEV